MLNNGTGRHIWDIDGTTAGALILQSMIGTTFLLPALLSSKVSFVTTLLRLIKGWWRHVLWAAVATRSALFAVSIFIMWFQCSPPRKTWDFTAEGSCWGRNANVTAGIVAGGKDDLSFLFLVFKTGSFRVNASDVVASILWRD